MTEIVTCHVCFERFERPARKGPIPKFCSAACRQKAFRRRQKTTKNDQITALRAQVDALQAMVDCCRELVPELEGKAQTELAEIVGWPES